MAEQGPGFRRQEKRHLIPRKATFVPTETFRAKPGFFTHCCPAILDLWDRHAYLYGLRLEGNGILMLVGMALS